MKSSAIRQAFFDYFITKGHQLVESSSLVPANDNTLLFTNAGMVQFKETFLGQEQRAYQRAVSAQRCVRAGGKHNDLDNVGYTARHHTFFEMLGNFSFGDYFKREAIAYAWEFLTVCLQLPPEKLWVTVYEKDDEAADIWLNDIGVSAQRFSRCGDKDNFWSMGDTGPCGPCTEIFFDHGPEVAGGPPGTPDADGDRYVEIWNLVFMQFNRDKQGHLHPLPKPSVDTGMGLERITAVVQQVHSNYDIDSFQYLIKAITPATVKTADKPSFNVIADHIRACAFLILDGVTPSNEGRGYVLRRIIRRAIRHGHKLQLPEFFFSKLTPSLVISMQEAYPNLAAQQAHIMHVLAQEETQFNRTLEQGLNLLESYLAAHDSSVIAGDVAFKLYDTYGFPLDLTQDIAREHAKTVDIEGFNTCMQQQRALSQAANQFEMDYTEQLHTDAQSTFEGYECTKCTTHITGLIQDNQLVNKLTTTNTQTGIILAATPFYAESGGQVGDTGEIFTDSMVFIVENTKRYQQAIIHYGYVKQGECELQQAVTAHINEPRREAIKANHTATHLLHAALKQVLGAHVQQKGSLVEDKRARFDFSHTHALTPTQKEALETLVNNQIQANYPVITELMSLDEAKAEGAVALFDEKYDEKVRVLSLSDFSKELCGGTHATRTGDLGLFKIINEYGTASGIRRLEFVTKNDALAWLNQQLEYLTKAALQLKTEPEMLLEKVKQLQESHKQSLKDLQQAQAKAQANAARALVDEFKCVNNIHYLIKKIPDTSLAQLRLLLDQLKTRFTQAVIVLYSVHDHKLNVISFVTDEVLKTGQTLNAPQIVTHLCGKGGGKPGMAQGGSQVPEDLAARVETLSKMLFTSDT